MFNTCRAAYLALVCIALTGCISPPKPEGTVSLEDAFRDIKSSLKSFAPKNGEEPIGVWLTDIQVVLKVAESAKRGGGAELAVTGGPKISFTSEATGSGENTITLTFKNPLTLSKDSIAGVKDAASPAPTPTPSPIFPIRPGLYTTPLAAK